MIIYILLGICSGIISGMGIGGGTILIPALTLLMGVAQKTAQGTNLLYFVPTATVALIHHFKNKRIRKDLIWGLIIGGVVGAICGSILANWIHGDYLRKGFGFFLLIIGLMEVFKKPKKKDVQDSQKKKTAG